MKKITLIASMLAVFASFAQDNTDGTIAITSPPTEIQLGESFTFEINYENTSPALYDFGFMLVSLRELTSTGVFVADYGASFPGLQDAGATNPGTVTVEYQVPTTTGGFGTDPITFEEGVALGDPLPLEPATAGNVYSISTYVTLVPKDNTNPDTPAELFNTVQNNIVTVTGNALSISDFAKDNISAAISQKDGVVTIADSVETEDYKLYDMTGALVIEKEADGIIDINGLPNGVYILSTDAGLTKIGK